MTNINNRRRQGAYADRRGHQYKPIPWMDELGALFLAFGLLAALHIAGWMQ